MCWIAGGVTDSLDMMKSCDKRDVNAEDVFVLQTPGGGGYGNDGHR
jgi:N-methylhydantoinase B/oxoprolinase/acetone carboxylase alpha subunit